MQPEFQGLSESGNDQFDIDIRDLELVETAGGSYLIAINGVNVGIVSFDITGPGLVFEDSRLHQDATLLTGNATGLATDSAGFVLGGTLGSDMQRYWVDENGTISALNARELPSAGDAGLRDIAHVDLPMGGSALYAITSEGALQGWRFDAADTPPFAIEFPTPIAHSHSALVTAAAFTDTTVLLVAEGDPGGVSSYVVDPSTGAATLSDQFGASDGLAISTPSQVISFSAQGSTWAAVGSSGSDSLTLFSVSEGGDLRFSDQVSDTTISRFQGVSALEEIAIGDHHFLVVAGQDDGFTILQVLPEGRLVHQTTIAHETGFGLNNVTALELAIDGGSLHIFASSQGSGGVAQFSVPLAELGASVVATSASLAGTNAGDLLVGRAVSTELYGRAGDDILVSHAAGDQLEGGAGSDLFVFHQVDGQVRVTDFTSGEDRLDLSFFSGLRNSGQLGFTSTSTGAILSYQDTTLRLESNLGGALDLDDVFWGGYHAVDRGALGDVSSDGVVYGSGEADVLTGSASADEIQGQSGNDSIDGQGGNDRLLGGDGADILNGGLGADTLFGGFANDQLSGGDAADRLYGEQGDDRVFGGTGDDEIWGGDGNDFAAGGSGSDAVSGGAGHDELSGNAGSDQLSGGLGADLLKGNDGNDTLYGNAGVDTLKGGQGEDSLFGGSEDDKLKGKAGDDTLQGGEGNDKLKGGAGQDALFGGAGDDRLDGGTGNDVYLGGTGADRFMFKRYHGSDRIDDFAQGEDLIDLRYLGQGGIKRFANLEMTQQGADVLIETGLGEIWLTNTSLSEMDGADFLF
jgi:Ca2+-binding RTX toxin-like protein